MRWIALSLALAGCSVQTGPQGPTGPEGPPGPVATTEPNMPSVPVAGKQGLYYVVRAGARFLPGERVTQVAECFTSKDTIESGGCIVYGHGTLLASYPTFAVQDNIVAGWQCEAETADPDGARIQTLAVCRTVP